MNTRLMILTLGGLAACTAPALAGHGHGGVDAQFKLSSYSSGSACGDRGTRMFDQRYGHYEIRLQKVWIPECYRVVAYDACGRAIQCWQPGRYEYQKVQVWVPDQPSYRYSSCEPVTCYTPSPCITPTYSRSTCGSSRYRSSFSRH